MPIDQPPSRPSKTRIIRMDAKRRAIGLLDSYAKLKPKYRDEGDFTATIQVLKREYAISTEEAIDICHKAISAIEDRIIAENAGVTRGE